LIFFCARSKLQNSLKYISQLHPCEDTKIEKLNDMNDSALGLTRIDFQSAGPRKFDDFGSTHRSAGWKPCDTADWKSMRVNPSGVKEGHREFEKLNG